MAANPLLNQHLCVTFTAKVTELNATTFPTQEDDDEANANDDEEVWGGLVTCSFQQVCL